MRHVIILALISLVAGCARPNYIQKNNDVGLQSAPCSKVFSNGLCVELKWEKPAVVAEDGSFVIVVTNLSGTLANTPVVPFVELYMPAHHHGSSPVDVTQIAPGMYRAEHLNFLMPGEWEIRVQLKNGETVLEQVVWTLTL